MAVERIDHRTYTPQGATWDDPAREKFFGSVQKGQAVDGRQGFTWDHDGSGWIQTDGPVAPAPGSPAATPEAPRIDPSLQTVKPVAPGGTPLPPSPPPTPAPQIPLGSPNATPGYVPNPNRNTAPGLIDANAPQQPAADPLQASVKQALLGMLGQNPNAASITDADISPQANAFRAAAERSALKNRAGLMERASAEGIADSEATRAAGRQIETQTGQAIGANDAALIGEKLQGRRDQIAQVMELAQRYGLAEESNDLARQLANLDAQLQTRGQDIDREGLQLQRDLGNLDTSVKAYLADLDAKLRREGYSTQERLAQLDAAVRREGIQSQGSLTQLELALRRELGIGELNLGYYTANLNNQQFNDQLGFNIGQWEAGLNKDALLAAMGGGR